MGSTMSVSLEPSRYAATVGRAFLTADTAPNKSDRGQTPDHPRRRSATSRSAPTTTPSNCRSATRGPGAYIFTLQPTPGDGPEIEAARVPGDGLQHRHRARRAAPARKGTDSTTRPRGAEVHSIDDTGWLDTLKQKQTDLSSGRWIYLVILLVLICEQAMAVRLSHHQRPEDLEAFAPSAAAAFAHGTPPPACRGRSRRPAGTRQRRVTRTEHDYFDEQAMNPTETTKETEFVFRRAGGFLPPVHDGPVALRAGAAPRRRGDPALSPRAPYTRARVAAGRASRTPTEQVALVGCVPLRRGARGVDPHRLLQARHRAGEGRPGVALGDRHHQRRDVVLLRRGGVRRRQRLRRRGCTSRTRIDPLVLGRRSSRSSASPSTPSSASCSSCPRSRRGSAPRSGRASSLCSTSPRA